MPHYFLFLYIISVGKTSLMNRYSTGAFTGQYKATIGADCLAKEVVCTDTYGQRHLVTLQIWDTAGQERFQSLGVAFYRGADAAMLVYDVTDVPSLDNLTRWKQEFLQQQPLSSLQAFGSSVPFPFVVVANKSDKMKERRIPLQRGQDWCRQHASNDEHSTMAFGGSLPHYETSAKTALNVEDAFMELARLALQYEDYKRRSQPKLFVPPTATVDLRRLDSTTSSQGENNNMQCC